MSVRFPARKSAVPFWAFPILGIIVKGIILIPHMIALGVLGFITGLLQVVTWIPVLFGGRYPAWGYNLVGGYVRWLVRVQVFYLGISDKYPSFSMAGDGSGQEAMVAFQVAEGNNRLYAIPLVGFVIKGVMLIPHMFVLGVLGIVVGVLQLVAWIPVVTAGRYPAWAYSINGGYVRWYARVLSFLLGLTDAYPPFQLGESMSQA